MEGLDEEDVNTLQIQEKRPRTKTFSKRPPGICDVLKYPTIRNNLLIAGFFYFVVNFNYYGASFAL